MNAPAHKPNPFPGLRSFQQDEDYLFFGREQQTTELLGRLNTHRFLAVVGTSGSGKSSLVRAGLLPALQGGTLNQAGSTWEILVLRPGGDPIANLARALLEAGLYGDTEPGALESLLATLRRSGLGFAEAVRQSAIEPRANLLVVVDQFEELFRYSQTGLHQEEEAAAFVELLLEASRQTAQRTYVCITMRSDYLGDCAQFRGLAEAVNAGEYLIPRLNRQQRRAAIEGPVKVGGAQISPNLVQRLLNDIGDDPDQLPILQHALMRTWDHWQSAATADTTRPIEIEDYLATGGVREALSRHADEVFDQLPDDRHRVVAEKIFRALTERGPDNRGIRRPTRLDLLCAVTGATDAETAVVVDAFRRHGRTFLMPMLPAPLGPSVVIDISHESLMRVWRRLRDWVEAEAQSARIYCRLAETAALYQEGKAGLFHDPDLQLALSWRAEAQPNAAWAERYHPGFDRAQAFLEQSERTHRAEAEAREAARQREVAQARALADAERLRAEEQSRAAFRLRWLVRGLGLVAMVAVAALISAMFARNEARNQARLAEQNAAAALRNAREAEQQTQRAEAASRQAETLLTQYQRAEGRTWLNRAQTALDQQSLFTARMLAGRAIGFEGYGRAQLEPAMREVYPTLLRPQDPEWESAQNILRASVGYDLLWMTPPGGLHRGIVRAIAYSQDGRLVATAEGRYSFRSQPIEGVARDATIRWWDAASGQLLGTVPTKGFGTVDLKFSPDHRTLVGVNDAGLVQVIDTQTGKVTGGFDVGQQNGFLLRGYTLSPDNRILATYSYNLPRVVLWEIPSGRQIRTLAGTNANAITTVAFHPNQPLLAMAFRPVGVQVWNIETAEPLGEAIRFDALRAFGIASLAFGPNGEDLAVGEVGSGPTAETWLHRVDWRTRTILRTWKGFGGMVSRLAFAPDGQSLAALDFNGDRLVILDPDSDSPRAVHRQAINLFNSLAFSPDGSSLSIAADSNLRVLPRPFTARPAPRAGGAHQSSILDGVVSADGRLLATADADGLIRLWNVAEGSATGVLAGHELAVKCLALTGTGSGLVSGGSDATIRVWDLARREQQRLIQIHDAPILSIAVHPSRDLAASGDAAGKLHLWEFSTGKRLSTFAGHTNVLAIASLAFSPDGRSMASAGGSSVLVWEVDSGKIELRFNGHTNEVSSVVFSPDGSSIASGGNNQPVLIWDASTGTQRHALGSLSDSSIQLSFSPNGEFLAGAYADGKARVWRLENASLAAVYDGHNDEVSSVEFLPDGAALATTSLDGQARLWNFGRVADATRIDSPYDGTEEIAYAPNGRLFAVAHKNGKVVLWDSSARKVNHVLSGHTAAAWTVTFSPDSRSLASGSSDGTVHIWDANSGALTRTLDNAGVGVGGVAFSSDGRWFAFGDNSSKVQIWDTRSWSKTRELAGHDSGPVHVVAFSPDSRSLLSGGRDGKILFWNPENGAAIRETRAHTADVLGLAFAPDGKRYASASGDRVIKLWDTESGRELAALKSHSNVVHTVVFHPVAPILASASADGNVCLWSVVDQTPIATLNGLEGGCRAAAISPDGNFLLAAGEDSTSLRRWGLAGLNQAQSSITPYLAVAQLTENAVLWKSVRDHLYNSGDATWFQPARGGYLGLLRSDRSGDALERELLPRLIETKNWRGARRTLDRIAGSTEDERRALLMGMLDAGQSQLNEGKPAAARHLAREALNLSSDSVPAIRLLARSAVAAGIPHEAREALDQLARAGAADAEDWETRGRVEVAQSRWNDAFTAYTKAIELMRADSTAAGLRTNILATTLEARARALDQLGRGAEAFADRSEARTLTLGIRPRDPQTPSNLIDLSAFFNASPESAWHQNPGNNLSGLAPFGVKTLGGVAFDVRGIIQLASRFSLLVWRRAWPTEVKDIPVNRPARALHFLHSGGWASGIATGTIVARYIVHFSEGESHAIDVAVGRDLRDWHFLGSDPKGDEPLDVVWTGTNAHGLRQLGADAKIRLFKTTWINPRPDVPIKSVDLVSAMHDNGTAFILAITAD